MTSNDPGSPDNNAHARPEHEEELLKMLECEASQSGDMNIERLVNEYKKHYPGEAVWRLTNDIHRQTLIWSNIIELLKNNPGDSIKLGQVKKWYETDLRSLPAGSLSNPSWFWDMDSAFQRLRSYTKGLLKIARSFATELLEELNVEVTLGTTIEVELGFPPSLTIGLHKGINLGAGAAVEQEQPASGQGAPGAIKTSGVGA